MGVEFEASDPRSNTPTHTVIRGQGERWTEGGLCRLVREERIPI